jgi:hypothetical protein
MIDGLVECYLTATESIGRTCVFVEVGCAAGESSEIAAQFCGKLYCVDPWAKDFDHNEPLFDERMKRFAHVSKIKSPSVEAANGFSVGSVCVAYIDGMHDSVDVRKDILAWLPKVRIGGWLGGHDYDAREDHAGVVHAVYELLGPPPHRFCDSSWLFRVTDELLKRVEERTQYD